MFEAGLWGLFAASSLLIGAAIGTGRRIPDSTLGLIMGFGAGALISAITFELTAEAFSVGGADATAAGLAAGALAFYFGDRALDRRGNSGLALLLGAVLDGIPESAVLGTTLIGGGEIGVALLVAVFVSNLPEAIGGAAAMVGAGRSRIDVLRDWGVVVVVSGLASAVGYGALKHASGNAFGVLQAFAAGGVLVMLIDEMIPSAQEKARNRAGLAAVLGFAVAAALSASQ